MAKSAKRRLQKKSREFTKAYPKSYYKFRVMLREISKRILEKGTTEVKLYMSDNGVCHFVADESAR